MRFLPPAPAGGSADSGAQGGGHGAPALAYRPEIDGLRAVAVLPVILFHAGFSVFGGGYAGVDVFFVISGYLITTIIAGELAEGRFSIAGFYERRARRILPALFLVLAACVPFAYLVLDRDQYLAFAKSLGAVILFVSNFHFWQESGYFASAAGETPLLHTWSLAIEEQFYLVFPVFMLVAWRFGPRAVFWSIAAFAVAGLAVAEIASRRYPEAAFFLPHARIWELDVGALCALAMRASPPRASAPLALAGLGMIAAAVLFFDEATRFPSLLALLPVGGTALVILFARDGVLPARLLSVRPLVAVGLVSYSAYLWHQPLFAFARIRSLYDPPQWQMALLAALSLGLAWASWRLVEQPFRRRGRLPLPSRRAVFLAAAAATAVFGAVAWDGIRNRGLNLANVRIEEAMRPLLGKAISTADCRSPETTAGVAYQNCSRAYEPHRGRWAVFGDSHAGHFFPALNALARDRGIDIEEIALGGCPPLAGAYVHRGNYVPETCVEVAARQAALVAQGGIDAVFLVARWSLYDGARGHFMVSGSADGFEADAGRYAEELAGLLARTVDLYRAAGARVLVVAQVPEQRVNAGRLYRKLFALGKGGDEAAAFVRAHSVTAREHADRQARIGGIIAGAVAGRAEIVDLTPAFCDEKVCPIGDATVSLYHDADHLSDNGAARAHAALAEAIAPGGTDDF